MAKIIREKYEAGVLISREVEVTGASPLKIAQLCVHIVIAISVAVIAVLSVRDSLNYAGLMEQGGLTDSACEAPPRFSS